ncbi:hypothetical protein [Vibrio parahaemolyticus]
MDVLKQIEAIEKELQQKQEERDSLLKKAQNEVLEQFKVDAKKCRITNEQIAEAFGIRIVQDKSVTILNEINGDQPSVPNFYYDGHVIRTISTAVLKKAPWRDLYLSGEINNYRVAYAKWLGGKKGVDEKWEVHYKDSTDPKPDWAKGKEKNVQKLDLNKFEV